MFVLRALIFHGGRFSRISRTNSHAGLFK